MKRTFLIGSVAAALVCIATPGSAATQYTYDALGRVTNVSYDDGSSIAYSYDAAGNRTQTVSNTYSAPITMPALVVPLSGFTVIPIP